jgi:drug/metabolite transporter (DMT)-like permease
MEFLWIPITLIAAAAQTARNATQRGLTTSLGVIAASQVRFLFGLPFAFLFYLAILGLSAEAPPTLSANALIYGALGAAAQVLAMMLQLDGMRRHSFAIVTAMSKCEPILIAIISVSLLAEPLSAFSWGGVVIATSGVVILSLGGGKNVSTGLPRDRIALVLGAASGLGFAGSAVWLRQAILALPEGSFQVRAATITVLFLSLQSTAIMAYLLLFDRPVLGKIIATWRQSIGAGIFGAIATMGWSGAMALTGAANVRTLALVEVLMAQAAQKRLFAENVSRRETLAMALIVVGAGLVVYFHY